MEVVLAAHSSMAEPGVVIQTISGVAVGGRVVGWTASCSGNVQ